MSCGGVPALTAFTMEVAIASDERHSTPKERRTFDWRRVVEWLSGVSVTYGHPCRLFVVVLVVMMLLALL